MLRTEVSKEAKISDTMVLLRLFNYQGALTVRYHRQCSFYRRRLFAAYKCLVAIDLKLGKFEAAHKGQMELYLRWLEKYEMVEGENQPIGLILCSGKNEEHIELMRLDESNIRVAEYMTKLPDMKLLEAKLKQSINRAKKRLASSLDSGRS